MNSVGPTVPFIGASGASGFAGASGISSWSGFSGISGYSGFSGKSGYSGFSGVSGRSGYSGFSGISGYSGYSGVSGYSGYSGFENAAPPLPAFDNVVAAYGLNNFNPVGYPAGAGLLIEGDNDLGEPPFTGATPYPLDWASSQFTTAGNPPYLISTWDDQSVSANNLTQASAARPILDTTNKWVTFDGTQTGLASNSSLYSSGSQTGTIYILFKAGSLVETSVLLEVGIVQTGAGNISIRLVAGVLTASITDATGLLFNSKIKTISDTNWHFIAFTFDTTNGTPANQTAMLVDNSTSGITSPVSTDLASAAVGSSQFNVGARNNAVSAFFTGNMRMIYCRSTVDDTAAKTAMYTYITYLQTLLP